MAKKKANTKPRSNDDAKLVAILSYITIIGWIIALVLNNQNKSALGTYHLRQTLLLNIAGIVLSWIPIIGQILAVLLFILWIIGFIGAIQGEKKPIPIIGEPSQEWFKSL